MQLIYTFIRFKLKEFIARKIKEKLRFLLNTISRKKGVGFLKKKKLFRVVNVERYCYCCIFFFFREYFCVYLFVQNRNENNIVKFEAFFFVTVVVMINIITNSISQKKLASICAK